MKTWYTCKVKYNKIYENGNSKPKTESYLVDAVSFTEAEARIYEKISEMVEGEFFVTAITKTKITDLLQFDDCEKWHKATVKFIGVDDDSGKEKTVSSYFLVHADTIEETTHRVKEALKTMLVPYDITSVSLSPIVDVFPFEITTDLIPLNEIGGHKDVEYAGTVENE